MGTPAERNKESNTDINDGVDEYENGVDLRRQEGGEDSYEELSRLGNPVGCAVVFVGHDGLSVILRASGPNYPSETELLKVEKGQSQ